MNFIMFLKFLFNFKYYPLKNFFLCFVLKIDFNEVDFDFQTENYFLIVCIYFYDFILSLINTINQSSFIDFILLKYFIFTVPRHMKEFYLIFL